jgi:hypothetical protein
MTQSISASDLTDNPNFLLDSIDFRQAEVRFLEVSAATYRDSAFLDHRLQHAGSRALSIPFAELARLAPLQRQPRKPLHFLFHSAFCGSTLLSRCLTEPGTSFALREPHATLDLATFKRQGGAHANRAFWLPFCQLVFDLLKKTYDPAEWALIKPTNIANNLLPEALAAAPDSRVLFLYADLDDFVVSNLKKGEEAERMTIMFARNFVLDTDYADTLRRFGRSLDGLDVAQAAVVGWHSQMVAFTRMLDAAPRDRVRTLYHEDFLDAPARALAAAYRFYGTPLTDHRLAAIVDGPLLKTDAKQAGRDYSPAQRAADKAAARARFEHRIDAAMAWARPLLDALPIPQRLPLPLLG